MGQGAFDTNGKSSINLTTSETVYDSSYTVFVAYDMDAANGTAGDTVGFSIFDLQSTLNFQPDPGTQNTFGVYPSTGNPARTIMLLHKETPDVPALTINVGWPAGKKVGGRTVYYSNDPSSLTFNSVSAALNGVSSTKYGLCSYDISAPTETSDTVAWQSTTISTATFSNLNLKHGSTYYLWVKAVSSDGYERATSAIIRIDLLPPTKPDIPTDTSPKSKSQSAFMASAKAAAASSSFWVNWPPASDDVSGILYYEIQERTDTSPVWQTVSTSSVNSYQINKDTYTDQGKFFYYRVRARNYAGTWGEYSDVSAAAYLSLPADFVKEFSTYPNPFDSRKKSATITFVLNQPAQIEFRIYDLMGGKVKQWQVEGQLGPNNLTWDGTDDHGNKVAAGMYILYYNMQGDGVTEKKRWKIGVIH
jgi:hypothetical protein